MAVQVSSISIPSVVFPYSWPLILSPLIQQQSSFKVWSPISMSQNPAPLCTNRHKSQAGVCWSMAWTICVGLTLSCLPHTSHFILLQQPQMLLSVPTDFHIDKRVSLDTGISPLLHPQGHGSHSASHPLFFFTSFFHPT